MFGLVLVTITEVLAIASIVPLMQLLTGGTTEGGATQWVSERLGNPSEARLTLALTGFVLFGFLLKGVVGLWIRWRTATIIFRRGRRPSTSSTTTCGRPTHSTRIGTPVN